VAAIVDRGRAGCVSGEREHSARSSRHVADVMQQTLLSRSETLEKLSGNMPDRAGSMPALPGDKA